MHPKSFDKVVNSILNTKPEPEREKLYVLTENNNTADANSVEHYATTLGVFKSVEAAMEFAEGFTNDENLNWTYSGIFVHSKVEQDGGTVKRHALIIQPTPLYED